MRIETLSYLRYGPFTDRTLTFRPDARLHIVYGPNEAGKTSALRGLSDLFFGFPQKIDARSIIRHDAKSLRIAATVVGRHGEQLSFRRRRGTKNTLIADTADETPLQDDCLAPFCGLLTQTVFERAFALDADRLTQGGAAMLSAGGEIGSLLFSASSGLMGMTELRRRLEEEAERIYAPRYSAQRSLHQVIDRHDAARKAEREQELRAGEFKTVMAEGRRLEAEMAALEANRLATRRRLDALARLAQLQPLVAGIEAEAARLALDAELAQWPEGTAEALEAALLQQREGQAALEPARAHRLALEARLAGRTLHHAALDAAADIAALAGLKGADETYRRDLPRVRAELAKCLEQMDMLARQLGFADATALEAHAPGIVLLDRLQRLADEGQGALQRHATLAAQRAEAQAALDQLQADGGAGRLIDPRPWQKQLAALAPDLQMAAQEDLIASRLAEAERLQALAIARLQPGFAEAGQVFRAPLPESGDITEAERQIARTAQALAQAAAGCARLQQEIDGLTIERAGLDRDGEIVRRADIVAARGRRDQTVAALLAGQAAAGQSLPAEIVEADRLADTAQSSAERIARHAALSLEIERRGVALASETRNHENAEKEHAAAQAAYGALFAASGIVPLEPARMQVWRRAVDDLRRSEAALEEERTALRTARMVGERLLPLLRSIGDAIGASGTQTLPLGALSRSLSERLADIASHWDGHRLTEGRREAERQRLVRLDEALAREDAVLDDWRLRYAAALPELGLPVDTAPETALKAILHFARLPELRQQRDELSRRVRGIEREIAGFETRVTGLAAAVEPGLAGHPVEVMASRLAELAETAKRDHQQMLADRQALEAAMAAEAQAVRAGEAAEAALATLVGDSPLPPTVLLPRLKARDQHRQALMAARARLAAQFPDLTEAEARAELAGYDAAAASFEVEALRETQEAEVQAHGVLRSALDNHERQRRAREEGVSAERAAFDKQAAEEEGRELARDWAVRRLASQMLTIAMERFRESRASPLMLKAGAIFSTLTGGRFVRLRQDLDDHDAIVLHAERDSGEAVPIAGLSEGTSHQLYLALRLAFLDDYATRNEPPPLICDDLFQSFDDDRTARGITALADCAPSFQTILMTHHQSVVDIARDRLGSGVDVILL